MRHWLQRWRPTPARSPETEAELRRRRNRATWVQHDRNMRLRRFWRHNRVVLALLVLAASCAALMGSGYLERPSMPSPWSDSLAFRHQLAARNCATARAVGLAPARRGEPGYWPQLDADGDGISCEPWVPWGRGAAP